MANSVDTPTVKCPLPDTDNIKRIKTSFGVIKEGKDMGHCAAMYAEAAVIGSSYMYHIGAPAPRGYTVEVCRKEDGSLYIQQAFGYRNSICDSAEMQNHINNYNKKRL